MGKGYEPTFWMDKHLEAAGHAIAERAFAELVKRAPQANPHVDRLLRNFEVYTADIRDKAVTAIYRNAAIPCKPCAQRFGELLEAQGLPEDFDLPGFRIAAKCEAVYNGVPIPMPSAVESRSAESTLAIPRSDTLTVRSFATNRFSGWW